MSYEQKCTSCMDQTPLDDFAIAMAYVPWQSWNGTCNLDEAFEAGTIFPELQKPFLCYKGAR
jgi:hypothetical protein